ncbi:MAG: VWA domain-containing protein [Acidobacteriota bacterium]
MRRLILTAIVVAGLGGMQPNAQDGAARNRQSYTSTTTAILVDVVVRDGKGRPLTDLSAADFEVTEDGLAQKVESFTRVSHGSGIGVGVAWKSAGKTITVPAGADLSTPHTDSSDDAATALVFDHLSSEALRLAQEATLNYVPITGESGVRVGVFATDPGIRTVQSFTTDRARVRQAVARVMPSGTTAEELKADRSDDLMTRRRDLIGQAQAAAASGVSAGGVALARTAADIGERETELHLLQTELNMLRSFDNLDRSHKGYDTAAALLAVVQSLSYLPGRKTIVFFSEGLPVSPALSARLDYVIDVANRANVTAYAVDARGLRSKSTMGNARKELDAFAEERLNQVTVGSDRTDQPLTMAFERVEDTLKLDSRSGLARLAEDTGGFLVEQTNDLSSAFRRIDEDNQFHYLLTYSPKNLAFDGKFRTIHVKVRRSGAEVFARKGYRAIHTARTADSGSYEIPALALLDRSPLPNAFPVNAAGFSFPDPARPGLTPVLVRLRTDALRFSIDRARATYSSQVAIVVRIRDGRGRDVQKLSQQYTLAGDAKDLEAAKNGEILFYREAELPPGVYTMESIVFDATGAQGSARVATLTVPAAERAGFEMSSLILVSKVEEVSDAPAADSKVIAPLYVGKQLLYPNLGEAIPTSAASELPFYFTLYGDVTGAKASAQLLSNGRPIAEAPVALSPSTGPRVQHIGRLPIGALPAGTYELRIRVTDGIGRELSRSAFFTLSVPNH